MKNFYTCIILIIVSLNYNYGQNYPFSTNNTHLTIWNDTEYIPFFIKGVNLGVAVPGTFPGEMAASTEDYNLWFQQIKAAGFNCIRLYTLHFPRFYQALRQYNLNHTNSPLMIIHGVWLEEEYPGFNHNLFNLSTVFQKEIRDNINCIHGNNNIESRLGKAYGTYTADVSPWCMAYVIGREVHPIEIHTTNLENASVSSYNGTHFSISTATASEVFFTSHLDYLVKFENDNYQTQRPVSASSWPTLDPIDHPEELNEDEDSEQINLSKIQLTNAPAGFFISYHAYPYYPDFISLQSDYQNFSDNYGPNSYKGYLSDLKSHYPNFPLIIAEYGVPSSWGIAHYASSSMNHGGFDEYNQGLTNMRLLETISDTNCGGGIHFAWIDEWFKRTWINDPLDYHSESRIIWHNVTSAEQNFGLICYEKQSELQNIANFQAEDNIKHLKADANYTFLELEIGLKNILQNNQELWVTLDTYSDELGESKLPNGQTIPHRSEFLLHITNYSANLYITQAYDTFGIWHNSSSNEQFFQSTTTDGAPWKIVRWKNNNGDSDVQYVGSLQLNHSFQMPSSKDGVIIHNDKIQIRIPWNFINFVAPDQRKVLHDNKATYAKEDVVSEGVHISVFYENEWFNTSQRYTWNTWTSVVPETLVQRFKTSYYVAQYLNTLYNSPAVVKKDNYVFNQVEQPISVSAQDGVLKNDFDIDGQEMIALLVETTRNGQLALNNDGSFTYTPNENFEGIDYFYYTIYDGYDLSKFNKVEIQVDNNQVNNNLTDKVDLVIAYPNPTNSEILIETALPFSSLDLFNLNGQKVYHSEERGQNKLINLSNFSDGHYLLLIKFDSFFHTYKLIKESK